MSNIQTSVIGDNGILPRFSNQPASQTEAELIELARLRVLRACEEEACFEAAFVEMVVNEEADRLVSMQASNATIARIRKAILERFLRVD